jgi:uncharacterized membrane protein (DUF373 family)
MSITEITDSRNESGGVATPFESRLNQYVGNYIHVFLSVLAIVVLAAALIAAFVMIYHGFPSLWSGSNEYQNLHQLLQNILLVAIAGELALLLLFHRTSAAIEVVLFVIARRLVATDVTALDLLVGSVALAVLLAVRFYFLPGKPR